MNVYVSEETKRERTTFKLSKSWVSPRFLEKGRDLSGESLVVLFFLFVNIYILICYIFNFSQVKKSSVGRDTGSWRDVITYTFLHSRPTSFPCSSPTHLLVGRVGQDPGNEIAHSPCI